MFNHNIVDTIEQRDGQAADKAIREHLCVILKTLPKVKAEMPNYFE